MPRLQLSIINGQGAKPKRTRTKSNKPYEMSKEERALKKNAKIERTTEFNNDVNNLLKMLQDGITNVATKHKRSRDYVRTFVGMKGAEGTRRRAVNAKNAWTRKRLAEYNEGEHASV